MGQPGDIVWQENEGLMCRGEGRREGFSRSALGENPVQYCHDVWDGRMKWDCGREGRLVLARKDQRTQQLVNGQAKREPRGDPPVSGVLQRGASSTQVGWPNPAHNYYLLRPLNDLPG